MTKLFEQPNVFNEWVTKSFEQFDVSDKLMGDKAVEWVDVSNKQVTEPLVCVFLWRVTCYIVIRLFTVLYFLVRSFRNIASYRHGYLDFQM